MSLNRKTERYCYDAINHCRRQKAYWTKLVGASAYIVKQYEKKIQELKQKSSIAIVERKYYD